MKIQLINSWTVTNRRPRKRREQRLLYNIYDNVGGPGVLSRYSDSPWPGRSGDRIPVEARFSAPVQTRPGAHHAFYTMWTGSFKGVGRPGRGIDHPPALATRLKKENSHTFTPLLGLRRLF